jgi:ribonuclease HII
MLLPYLHPELIEAGCDEAGRGCLAGPVFAACVILPKNFSNALLNDSKKLNEKQRNQLRVIIEQETQWAVASCNAEEIDQINILNASILAMHKAIKKVSQQVVPEYLLIDGNRFKPFKQIPHQTVIKGDGKYMCIAAASILAKTHRDEYMLKISKKHPAYQWQQNKGYPTAIHREMIKTFGHTPFHRKTFMPVSNQIDLFK